MFIDITQNIIPGIYDYYMISNCGRVFNKYLNIYLSPGVSGSGYLFVYLSTDHGQVMVQLHRLVMMSFYPIPNCNIFQVNHINGDKFDNRIFNLEWCTRSENQRHAFMTGLHKRPSDLNEDDIRHVCDLLAMDQYTNLQISLMVGNGLTETIVSDIKKKTCWKDISKDYTFHSRKGKKFSTEEIENLCTYFSNNNIGNSTVNDHCRNALKYFGYDDSDSVVDCARKVYTRKYYTNISSKYNF
jgi:hypothetical protein|nr:MAG TPA: homing endonuclease [Caudoviricetes sp.]